MMAVATKLSSWRMAALLSVAPWLMVAESIQASVVWVIAE